MAMVNTNLRTDAETKAQCKTHSENPAVLKSDIPNETTLAAFREGDEILADTSVKGYTNIKDLRAALEV